MLKRVENDYKYNFIEISFLHIKIEEQCVGASCWMLVVVGEASPVRIVSLRSFTLVFTYFNISVRRACVRSQLRPISFLLRVAAAQLVASSFQFPVPISQPQRGPSQRVLVNVKYSAFPRHY